ncbi:hypothetical protein [Solitalea koreensis]|uniref:Uncharacterized protein n=1 Tax=Solitalea koreensis TaxID=543615 RepID=A0A521CJ57_9SPHI|nr:hypothetical protein [Solitalea koreensis]SMO58730.1 hypothetical protein SAMN06265350_10466 [Solitalea koreensis]
MPLNDLMNQHFTAVEMSVIDGALNTIQNTLQAKCRNLSPEERVQLGSINEQNKLLVNKVRDYNIAQPAMRSPDVNWVEFEADWQDRSFLDTRLDRINMLAEMMMDTKILHDSDNYQHALLDYKYTKYKADTDAGGFKTKCEDIKQLFPNTGTTLKKESTQERAV